MLIHNDIKKGAKLYLTGGREATMQDNAKGISRLVEITAGGYPDWGSVYVWDILQVEVDGEWKTLSLSKIHEKKMANVKAWGF